MALFILVIIAIIIDKLGEYAKEQRKYKNIKVGFGNYKNNYKYDEENPILEDIMFYTGLSDEELDEILPDYDMDLEDFE